LHVVRLDTPDMQRTSCECGSAFHALVLRDTVTGVRRERDVRVTIIPPLQHDVVLVRTVVLLPYPSGVV